MADIGYDGQVAIITGAGGGLGREHALELARRGARIVVNDLGGSVRGEGHDEGPAHKTAKEINDLGGEAVADTNSVATARGRRGHRPDRGRRVRHRRHRHQQRRHPAGQDVPQHDARAARTPCIDVHLRGAFYVTQPAWIDHAGEGLRPRRQHLVELGHPRQLRPVELRRRQDGPRRLHPGAGQRGPQVQHQGQRHRPGGQDPHDRGAVRRRRRPARPQARHPGRGLAGVVGGAT